MQAPYLKELLAAKAQSPADLNEYPAISDTNRCAIELGSALKHQDSKLNQMHEALKALEHKMEDAYRELEQATVQVQSQVVEVVEGQQGALVELTNYQAGWQDQIDGLKMRFADDALNGPPMTLVDLQVCSMDCSTISLRKRCLRHVCRNGWESLNIVR